MKYDMKDMLPDVPLSGSKLGIALGTIGSIPINGLRHPVTAGTNGWYIWCGEDFPTADDAFSPLCVEHVSEYLPSIQQYLNLPPGYRFLIDDNGYEDVWFDDQLLNT